MDHLEGNFLKIAKHAGDSPEYIMHEYQSFESLNKSEKDVHDNINDQMIHTPEQTVHEAGIINLTTKSSFANLSREGQLITEIESQIDSEYSNNNDHSPSDCRRIVPIRCKRLAGSKSIHSIDLAYESRQVKRESPRIFSHRSLPPSELNRIKVSEKVLYSCEVTKHIENFSKSLDSSVITFNKNRDNIKIKEDHKDRRNSGIKVSPSKLNLEMIKETRTGSIHSESEPDSPYKTASPIRTILNNSLRLSHQTRVIDFQQALRSYNQIQTLYFFQGGKKVWKTSLFQRICCRVKSNSIEDTETEICEKIITFAYSPVSMTDTFHKNLIISSYMALHNIKEIPDFFFEDMNDARFTSINGFELNTKHALLVFLNILFLEEYFPSLLNKSIEYSKQANISLMGVISSATKITMKLLRERRLNEIISKSDKCLEVIFFAFAGLFIYNITYQQMHGNLKSAFTYSLKNAKNNALSLITVAKNMYQAEDKHIRLY